MLVQLQGSRVVESINDRFTATMTNVVRWQTAEEAGASEERICSDATIQVALH